MPIPSITLNKWSFLLISFLVIVGFVIFYPEGVELIVSAAERLIGALGKVTSDVFS